MNISNNLRQEYMPEMIYSICKLVGSKSYDKDELKRLITLGSSLKESGEQYNKVYNFAIDCGFISEDISNKICSNFNKEELLNFRHFRYAIFSNIFKNSNTMFKSVAEWYLSQNMDIFDTKSTLDLLRVIPQDLGVKSEEYLLGFRFWMVTLGLAMLQKSGNSSALVFTTNHILLDWIEISKPFKSGENVIAKDFFKKLTIDCPIFKSSINNNDINLALSMGLRVLDLNNVIELKYTPDSGDIWHLINSISQPKTNHITEIIVR